MESWNIIVDALIAARATVDREAAEVLFNDELEQWNELYDHISDFLANIGAFETEESMSEE